MLQCNLMGKRVNTLKKTLILLTLFTLFFTIFCMHASASDTLDVGLFYGSNAKSSVTVVTDFGPQTVTADALYDDLLFDTGSTVFVEGKEYRGSIILKRDSNGLITVINRVDIEDYIASVVSKEMSPSFNEEALKAQAVCARTYAYKNMGKHKKYGFDLCSSVDCQAYAGVSSEHEKTTSATKQTEGLVMKYDGKIIEAVYSATSGGWTEDVKNVWGSDIPYLVAAEDSYESKDVYASSWTKDLTVEKATQIMQDKGYNLGTITDIKVVKQTERGVVTELKVVGTLGEKTFYREGCRLAFGSVTPSQAFSVIPKYENAVQSEPLYAYGKSRLSDNICVISADGVSKRSVDNVTLKGNSVRTYTAVLQGGEASSFTLVGRGNGHLVGMSQNGANGMAAAGFSFDEILRHYYKGIDITCN